MNLFNAKIKKQIREGWPGHHFTRNGESFIAPKVRSGGATDQLIEYAVDVAVQATRDQIAADIDARAAVEETKPFSAESSGVFSGLIYATNIALGRENAND